MPRRFISRMTSLPKGLRPLCAGRAGGGVGPFGIAAVCEGHVPNTQVIVFSQCGQIAVDHVAALDAEQHYDFVLFADVADFGGGGGESEVVGMLADLVAHSLNLLGGTLNGDGTGDFARHPDREENCVEAAFFHARDVHAAFGVVSRKIEIAVDEALWGVGVGVDHERREMQLARAGGQIISLGARIHGASLHGNRSEHECDGECTVGNDQCDSASLTFHSSSGCSWTGVN